MSFSSFNISFANYHPVFLQGIVLVNGVSAILYQIGLQLLLVKHNISRIVTVMTLASKLDHAVQKKLKSQIVLSLVRNTNIDLFAFNFKIFIWMPSSRENVYFTVKSESES